MPLAPLLNPQRAAPYADAYVAITMGMTVHAGGTNGIPADALVRVTMGMQASVTADVLGRYADAVVSVTSGLHASVSAHTGPARPATVWEWGTPEVDPELLRTLRVRLATRDGEYTTVSPAEIDDLVLESNRKGGVASIQLTLQRSSREDFGDLDYGTRCEVEYLGRVWPAFVRESPLSHDRAQMGRAVRLLGFISRLSEEHEAFRRVYVDSRLSAWKTDQGPQTQANVWEVGAQ